MGQQRQNTGRRRWSVYVGRRRSQSDERSWRGRTSETSWQSSAKYDGARLSRHWQTRTAILNSTSCRTDCTIYSGDVIRLAWCDP